MVYFIPLLLILSGIYAFDYRGKQKFRLGLWALICLLLICMAGFRFRLGGDTIQYMMFYERLHDLHDLRLIDFQKSRYAPGFVILASLCKSVTSDFIFMQFVVSAFLNVAVFIFFWKNTRNPFFGILLYYFFLYLTLNMEVMREAMAVGIFLLSWPLLEQRKWIQYIFLALFASLFHISAFVLILVPIIFLPGIRFFFRFGVSTLYLGIFILIAGFVLRYFLFDFIQMISINEKMTELAHKYAKNDLGGLRTLNIFGICNTLFIYVLYPCIALFFLNKFRKDKLFKKEQSLAIVSIYISLLSVSVLILGRFNNYFIFFCYLILSEWIFSNLHFRSKRLRLNLANWTLVFLPLFLFSVYSVYFSNVNRDGTLKTYMKYWPYNSVFDPEQNPDREKVFRYNTNQGF